MNTQQVTIINLTEDKLKELITTAVEQVLKNTSIQQADEGVWLTRAEAAKHLKICPLTLSKYTRLHVVPVHRTGRKMLYNLDELNNAIKNLKIKYK